MAEQLGGSRGRNDNLSGSKLLATPQRPSSALGQSNRGAGRAGGGLLGATPMSARHGIGGKDRGPLRPASAPKDRPSTNSTVRCNDARARVEELRQLKEAQYWGRDVPVKRDLPAYWSLTAFGQPFNDERLFNGASNHYQLSKPVGVKPEDTATAGPATEQQAALRRSLLEGKRYFDPKTFAPVPVDPKAPRLTEAERLLVISKLNICHQIHAYRNCLDRDLQSPDFTPWPQQVWDKLDAKFWKRSNKMAIQLSVQKLENMMRRHLRYLSEQKCADAHAPAARTKDVLREAFWKVDPSRTGHVSLQQFLQVWQNVLCLLEYTDSSIQTAGGKRRVVLQPGKRFLCDRNMAAAIFVKYGFDKDGLMPYVVFSQALCAKPARLLGQELVLDKADEGKHGLSCETDVAYCIGDAKIIYPKCKKGVFPPSGFDPRVADRSSLPPTAHMWLEHVYGYAGMDTLQSNVFYTHNTNSTVTEIVYYSGCVGVVMDRQLFAKGQACQRYFFGHSNDITCLTMHPSRKFVATGQQKSTGKASVPYVCIWDVDNCNLLQRLDHESDHRSILACCFSGNMNAPTADKQGGDLLVTITSDDKHTIHIWRWMTQPDKFCKARCIPGWYFGPSKKLDMIKHSGTYYHNPELAHPVDQDALALKAIDSDKAAELYGEYKRGGSKTNPMAERVMNDAKKVVEHWEQGYCDVVPSSKADGTWEKLFELPGQNGTPPAVYGVAWNPLRPQDGRRGSEFCTYGVKHLKTWIVNDEDQWQCATASFGTDHIQNVLSAIYVPALHYMAAPGDSCILTGFASGEIGLWVPPYPTRAGLAYTLVRNFLAHGPGQVKTLNDGSQQYGGVRVIKLRPDPTGKDPVGRTIITGGSDGCVLLWQLEAVSGTRKDGTPLKGVNLTCLCQNPKEEKGPNRFLLQGPTAPNENAAPPSITALDCHPASTVEFVAGTDGCDIWEVDSTPCILVEGHEEDVYHVATHPTDPNTFATGATSGKVRLWDMQKHDVVRTAYVGFGVAGIGFSNEQYGMRMPNPNPGAAAIELAPCFHLAIGSSGGYNMPDAHRVVILKADTLQPIKVLRDPTAQVDEIKYSPASGPGILAVGGCDMTIYLYSAKNNYQAIAKCIGHSGNIEHIDWSLPISLPGMKLHGSCIIQASDASCNLLYWDPKTGKKIPYNQRDAPWHTWTTRIGFPVMGIWPDASDRTDINSVCVARRGQAVYTPPTNANPTASDHAASVMPAAELECADGVPTCSYLVTADDFSTIRLFNYPVVADDAPYKAFRGHASHVMDVRFNCNDRHVVSVGGHDRSVFQWRTCGVALSDNTADQQSLAIWQTASKARAEKDRSLEPIPGVEWAALDDTGKLFGPKAGATASPAAAAPQGKTVG